MKESPRRLVPAVERATAILDHVAQSAQAPGVSELARALALPKSSVHGICETLCALGLLREEAGGFAIGPHVLRWSGAFLARADIVRDFERLLATDRRLAEYTVTLSVLQGDRVIYMGCRNADRPLGFAFQIGMGLPAVYTATGKAMLQALPLAERDRILCGPWPAPFTARSVADRSAFEAEIAARGLQRYALDDGQIREGMHCIGAAVLGADGRPTAGIAISMTSAEAKPDVVRALGEVTADLAARLSHTLPRG